MGIGFGAHLPSKGTGRTFIAEEWMFVADRQEIAPSTLFADHNGHLVAIVVIAAFPYMVVFGLVGLDEYRLLGVLAVLAHLGTALSIVRYLFRRSGTAVAIGAGLVVALSGGGGTELGVGFPGHLRRVGRVHSNSRRRMRPEGCFPTMASRREYVGPRSHSRLEQECRTR